MGVLARGFRGLGLWVFVGVETWVVKVPVKVGGVLDFEFATAT